ncbi:MAG: toprim domain-containing protein [Proteobacteria bacterium]|nr:toprim domain-containing protein [Pseudomonadota bacterium]
MGNRMDVRTAAQGRWRGILHGLGMDERSLSGKHGPCPLCGGKDRFRFDDKDGRGTYYCSGCGAGDGVKLAMALTGQGFRDTALQIERLAGVVQPVVGKPERSDEDKLQALRRVWKGSKPIQRGDEAETYLTGRGLRLYDLPESIRVHPGLQYMEGEVVVGTFAAMVATVTGPDGKALSIHRTYIQNGQKAPVAAPKKLMQGFPIAGAAIRLTPVSQVLGISEGIETALAASELFEVPVWSCISAQGVEGFEPPAGVEHVIVFADNDANFAGQAAAYRAAHRLKLRGFAVEVCVPLTVGDWLDELGRRAREM